MGADFVGVQRSMSYHVLEHDPLRMYPSILGGLEESASSAQHEETARAPLEAFVYRVFNQPVGR
jgi:hypothetical protein